MLKRLRPVWMGLSVTSYEEAISLIDGSRSPGVPYSFKYPTKHDAVLKHNNLQQEVNDIFNSEKSVDCVFTMLVKHELRPKEKVLSGKVRIFNAGPLHHHLAACMCFFSQNQALIDHRYSLPLTLGIRMPGPEFPSRLYSFSHQGKKLLRDGDVSGCDARFNLGVARLIRDLRKAFLPSSYYHCVDELYASTYCGLSYYCGGIYRTFGNKSGWFNTTSDNTLMTWIMFVIASLHYYPSLSPDSTFELLCNGDDHLFSSLTLEFDLAISFLKSFNFIVEFVSPQERSFDDVVYLSHTLMRRFVPGFGEFLVAAGNLPKLRSSVNWVCRRGALTFEEACVSHLIGLRICLFPWQFEFAEVDDILTNYLLTISTTPNIERLLRARFSEFELSVLHTRAEGFDLFSLSQLLGLTIRHDPKNCALFVPNDED